ncbi:hypothetical protein JW960_14385 [candidate division KSB1 bacterium]|nr:hypothetical protein [candidate division KSB1 bacterium]
MIKRTLIFFTIIATAFYITCKKDNPAEPTATPMLTPAAVTDTAAWTVNPGNYTHLMTIVATIKLHDQMICSNANKLAAFAGDEVRGVGTPYNHLGCVNYNLIVYSNSPGDSITFGIYLADQDTAVAALNTLVFTTIAGHGSPDFPYAIEVE